MLPTSGKGLRTPHSSAWSQLKRWVALGGMGKLVCPCSSDRRHGQALACPCHPSAQAPDRSGFHSACGSEHRNGKCSNRRESSTWTFRLLVVLGTVALVPSCRKPSTAHDDANKESSNQSVEQTVVSDTAGEVPNRVDIGVHVADSEDWLSVDEIRDDAPGAWATGSFLAERNRIVIETEAVARFSIDMGRVPVRWERLVVIRIDGRNSELVKRDQAIYRFALDEHGHWVVLEP